MRAATTRSACSSDGQISREALIWLARFPVLGEAEIAALLDADAWIAAAILRDARRRGWVASVLVDSPEFDGGERLSYLTASGVASLAQWIGIEPAALCRLLPLSRRELLERLVRVEVTLSIARFVASLAADLRRGDAEITLEEIRSTHWVPRRGQPGTMPPFVEASGRLRHGNHIAPFLLAWDRASAPYDHRHQRVVSWYHADETPGAVWGPSLPPVLVVCAGGRHLTEWIVATERSADRRRRGALRLAIAANEDLDTRGPLGADWWRPRSTPPVGLLDLLAWRPFTVAAVDQPASPQQYKEQSAGAMARPGNHTVIGLPDWTEVAHRSGRGLDHLSKVEQNAALAVGLSATQKALLNWIAHHPLLPRAHLAAHLHLNDRSIERLMARLVACGLILEEANAAAAPDHGRRYVLTMRGAGYLAARDGVSLALYLRDGVIAAEGTERGQHNHERGRWRAGQVRLADVRRRPEHTAGVYHFALVLSGEASWWRAQGVNHRVLAWRNAAESQEWFRWAERLEAIRPDARFWYRADGVVYDLIVEWDRGLVRRRDYTRKFSSYAAYFAVAPATPAGIRRLVVVTPAAAIERVRMAVDAAGRRCPFLNQATRIITPDVVVVGRLLSVLGPPELDPGGRSRAAGDTLPWSDIMAPPHA